MQAEAVGAVGEWSWLLPFNAVSARAGRGHVTQILRSAGVGPSTIDDACAVLTELLANSVRHARPRPDGQVLVTMVLDNASVSIAVADGGGATVPNLDASGAARPERSRAGHRAHAHPRLGCARSRRRQYGLWSPQPDLSGRRRSGQEGTNEADHREQRRHRPPPALSLRIRTPVQGVSRQRRRFGGLRRAYVRGPAGGVRLDRAQGVRLGGHRWPAASLRAPTTARADGRTVTVTTVLPGIAGAIVRADSEVRLAVQVAQQSADLSRDFAEALRLALLAAPR